MFQMVAKWRSFKKPCLNWSPGLVSQKGATSPNFLGSNSTPKALFGILWRALLLRCPVEFHGEKRIGALLLKGTLAQRKWKKERNPLGNRVWRSELLQKMKKTATERAAKPMPWLPGPAAPNNSHPPSPKVPRPFQLLGKKKLLSQFSPAKKVGKMVNCFFPQTSRVYSCQATP